MGDRQPKVSNGSDGQDDEEQMGGFPTEFGTVEDLLKSLLPLHGPLLLDGYVSVSNSPPGRTRKHTPYPCNFGHSPSQVSHSTVRFI